MPGGLVYLYGFAPAGVRLPSRGIEGRARVERIERGGVCAVVSSVPRSAYDEKPLKEKTKDPAWLVERAGRHARVLQEILERAPVVPCRFGALFRNRARVVEVLVRRRRELVRLLGRLRGRAEWSLKAYTDARRAGGAAPATGTGYLLKRVRVHRARRQAARTARLRAKEILAAVPGLAEEVVLLPLRLNAPGTPPGELFLLNLALLVRRSGARRLQARLRALAARQERRGVRLTWSGPWPAYSFVEQVWRAGEDGRSPRC